MIIAKNSLSGDHNQATQLSTRNVAIIDGSYIHFFLNIELDQFQYREWLIKITLAPQKDICPQVKTYPINSVAIIINRINTPQIDEGINSKPRKVLNQLMLIFWVKNQNVELF